MKNIWIIFITLILSISANCADSKRDDSLPERSTEPVDTEAFLNDLPDTIESWMDSWNLPGLAVGIVKDGETIFLRGFGYRDREENLSVTTKTLFPIASCTKSFTALTAFILEEEGSLDIDAKIKDYLPDFEMMEEKATKKGTVRNFLQHRSGLSPFTRLPELTGFSREEIFARLRHVPPQMDFDRGLAYSNLGYMVAGHIEERVASKPWKVLVSEKVLGPVGMTNTCFTSEDMVRTGDYASPYVNLIDFDEPARTPIKNFAAFSPAGGGGGIITDIEGLAAWVTFNLDEGKAGGRQLVSKKHLEEMYKPHTNLQTDPDSRIITESGCGLGWFSEKYRGYDHVYHGGLGDGWISQVSFIPEEGIGVVVMTNLYYNHLHQALVYHIFDNLLGLAWIDHNARELSGVRNAYAKMTGGYDSFWQEAGADKPASVDLEAYSGAYSNPVFGTVSVEMDGDGLGFTFESGIHLRTRHYGSDTFATEDEDYSLTHLKLNFQVSREGEVISLSIPLVDGVDEFVFVR